LLNFPALAFGASNSFLIVFCHGQGQGEIFLAPFARVFIAGHKQNLRNVLRQYSSANSQKLATLFVIGRKDGAKQAVKKFESAVILRSSGDEESRIALKMLRARSFA
jgi:hypothetical protein